MLSREDLALRHEGLHENLIGESVPRIDSHIKVTGRVAYVRDMRLPWMLYGVVKRCPLPHARIRSIDISRAQKIPRAKVILTGTDVPDAADAETPILARQEVLYSGQAVVAIAAESSRIGRLAAESISIDYEELPAVYDPELAMSERTPTIIRQSEDASERPNVGRHIRLRRGDVERGFAESDRVVENRYSTQMESHFQMEPFSCLAKPDVDGGITVWCPTNGAHFLQYRLAGYLQVDPDLVRVKVPLLGGWFGGKDEYHVAALCATLAMKAGRPVKLELSREEAMTDTAVRHPSIIYVKDGVTKDGRIIAREIRAIHDGGAYGAHGNALLRNSILAATNVYDIPNLKIDAYRVYTNHVVGAAKRAPMGPQMVWALEGQMERIAQALKIDPIELRLKNALSEGAENARGERMHGVSSQQCLAAVAKAIGWGKGKASQQGVWRTGKGIALAAKWSAGGPQQAQVKVRSNGKVEVWIDAVENGQGIFTTLAQVAATEFGIPIEDVIMMPFMAASDSSASGVSGGASASRQMLFAGNAVRMACQDAKMRIAERACNLLGVRPGELDVKAKRAFVRTDPSRSVSLSDLFMTVPLLGIGKGYGLVRISDKGEFVGYGTFVQRLGELDKDTGQAVGGPLSPEYTGTALGAEVSVNIETGQVKVNRIVAAMDVGKAINPEIVRGQIIGTVTMGLNAALSEEVVFSNGRVTNPNLADYKLLTAIDAPPIEPIIIENPFESGPYGAKGAGEASILVTASALGGAIHDAVGVWISDLPITAERVLSNLASPDAGRGRPN